MFANLYLSSFDHFVKSKLKVKYYSRYVDDFILLFEDKQHLESAVFAIKKYLEEELRVTIHPKKIYLQPSSAGVEFLGSLIKPYKSYSTVRVKGNFYEAVKEINRELKKKEKLSLVKQDEVLAKVNSYLGVLGKNNTYSLREKMLSSLNCRFWSYFKSESNLLKVEKIKKKKRGKVKKRYNEKGRMKNKKGKVSIWKINRKIELGDEKMQEIMRDCEEWYRMLGRRNTKKK